MVEIKKKEPEQITDIERLGGMKLLIKLNEPLFEVEGYCEGSNPFSIDITIRIPKRKIEKIIPRKLDYYDFDCNKKGEFK